VVIVKQSQVSHCFAHPLPQPAVIKPGVELLLELDEEGALLEEEEGALGELLTEEGELVGALDEDEEGVLVGVLTEDGVLVGVLLEEDGELIGVLLPDEDGILDEVGTPAPDPEVIGGTEPDVEFRIWLEGVVTLVKFVGTGYTHNEGHQHFPGHVGNPLNLILKSKVEQIGVIVFPEAEPEPEPDPVPAAVPPFADPDPWPEPEPVAVPPFADPDP